MMLTLIREGVAPSPRKDALDADGWRSWAYEEAKRQQVGRLVQPVRMVVTPAAHDRRGIKPADSVVEVTRLVIDGLVAAGVLVDARDIVELVVRRARVAGKSMLTVELEDADEPF